MLVPGIVAISAAEHIKITLQQALPLLQRKFPIRRIGLFGSATRHDFNSSTSDIDVMVELGEEAGYEFIELAEELERLFKRKVDLVSRYALKPGQWEYLKEKIIYV